MTEPIFFSGAREADLLQYPIPGMGPAQIQSALTGLARMLTMMKPNPHGDYSFWEPEKELTLPSVSEQEYSDLCALCIAIQAARTR